MQTFYQRREGSFLCTVSTNLNYPPHLHKQMELIYVLSGNITVTIHEESRDLLPGDIAVSFPGTIHSIKTSESSRNILLIFDPYLVDLSSLNIIGKKPVIPFLLKDTLPEDISYCMNHLLEITKPYDSALGTVLIKGYLTILIARLLESLTLKEIHGDDLNLVHQVLVYIDDHFTESLTLEQVAKKLNTSKFYLSRIFNHQLNTPFNQYLNNQRIQLAQYLLADTDLSVTEISFQSGFESTRTFYRAFKEICRMTPTKYRKLNQKS